MPKRYSVSRGPGTTAATCTLNFDLVTGDAPDPTDHCPPDPEPIEAPTALCDKIMASTQHHPGHAPWTCADLERLLGVTLKPRPPATESDGGPAGETGDLTK